MRILMIITNEFNMSGITNNVMNYYRYMDKREMKIDFVAPNNVPERLKNEINSNGGVVYELTMRNRNPIKYIIELKKIIQEKCYDIVHAHGNSCTLAAEMYAAKLAGTKVRIAHSRNTKCQQVFFNKILRNLFDKSYTHGFACGVDAGKWLFRDKEFTVIKNGNDIDKFKYNNSVRYDYRKKLGVEGKKVIGHVGLFNHQKNHEFLIDIFNELIKLDKNYILIMVGDGELKSTIEDKVESLGLKENVIFTGKSLEVEKLIQAMDIMVLPSRYEGLPNVVIEWQIACLPCIISDNADRNVKITELVKFISLNEKPREWARLIDEMKIEDRNLIKDKIISEITEAGFSIKENAQELSKIYNSLLNN